ncbi:AraC family transcriptional regulator [Pseudomaricurvus alkylphenolicus]|uniref:AraC family transcriptional regulator n=1 Tax=Pseudomaricurvus alkylphenolicus TaxID=1306991 RepID=UPI001421D192|nr:AraC family transcriptional regulator [Pseudomaricurvus alkylphenolicus]NIB44686.1 AraC family transcriptional regulator [Pseudomaricurvus alkylphenolicus]
MSIVYASALTVTAKMCNALGVPFEALAHKVGFDPDLLNRPDATLSVDKYLRLHDEIMAMGKEDFGLLMGRISYMESFHLYMSVASASHTFRDWINLLPAMNPALGNLISSIVKRKADYLILEMGFERPATPTRCLLTDNFLSSVAMLMDGFCMLPVRPVRVDVTYSQPADTKMLNDVLRAPLYFNQPASALYYDKSILDIPPLHVSTSVYDNMNEELNEFLSHNSWTADSFTTNLYSMIRHQLASGECTLKNVAEKLNMSSRTLQLRLQERDTQFRHLVQQVRSSLALKYLRDKNFSVINIAILLGYRDSTAFSTAFKSWHNCTPSEYRKKIARQATTQKPYG